MKGEGGAKSGDTQHIKVKSKKYRKPIIYGIMLKPVVRAGRLQVRQEELYEGKHELRGAEQPEHGFTCGASRQVMKIIKTGVQIKVTFLVYSQFHIFLRFYRTNHNLQHSDNSHYI